MIACVHYVHNLGANDYLAPTTPARKRPAEDCDGPPAKVIRALSQLRGDETPPGFRIASNGNAIPASMNTSSHSARREYLEGPPGLDDQATTVSSSDPDAVPGTPEVSEPEEEDSRKVARRNRRAARTRAWGGVYEANQECHMNAGGCLDPDKISVDSDVSSDDDDGHESDDEEDEEDEEDGPAYGCTILVPETPPASPKSPGSPSSAGIVVPESPLH